MKSVSIIGFLILFLFLGAVNACDHYCYSCNDCTAKINAASAGEMICLSQDIVDHVGTCIYDPEGFNNKIFDCQGHTIDGDESEGDSGIYIYGKNSNTIRNCIITDFYHGIHLYRSSNNNLINNTVNNNTQHGIYLLGSPYNNIINNTVNNNNNGIYYRIYLVEEWAAYSNNNNLINNTVSSNYYHGIYLYYSSNNNISNNQIRNNGDNGIYFNPNSTGNILNSNIICLNKLDINNEGANRGDNNTCNTRNNWNDDDTHGCTFSCLQMPQTICYCSNCSDCNEKLDNDCSIIILTADIINHTGTCINNPYRFNGKIFDCQGHTIDGNESEGSLGIYIDGKNSNTIRNCIITDFYYGIHLYRSSNNNLINNTVNNNNNGIYLVGEWWAYSNNNNLINNTVSSNYYHGIYLYYSSNNNISNNQIRNNGDNGIYFNPNSTGNILNSNIICLNKLDINNEGANQGDNNICENYSEWNDTGIERGCTYRCDGTVCDADNDYYVKTVCGGTDCNDTNASINPEATEICNEIDDNCNNQVDEGLQQFTYFRDADIDTYGNMTNNITTCYTEPPSGYVKNKTDCDDNNASINPGATEICNGIDDNCNNQTDEGDVCLRNITLNKTASTYSLPPGGGNITYYYIVTNTGNVPLTNINVTDDKCLNVTCPNITTLAPGENTTCNCTMFINDTTTNVANVTAWHQQQMVNATANVTVTVNCTEFDLDNNNVIDIFDVVAGLEHLSYGAPIVNEKCSARNQDEIDLFDLFILIEKI